MIAIARKNLFSLLLSPKSVFCNSNAHLSTWKLKRLIPSAEMYDLLVHKHNFSPELISRASPHLARSFSPEGVHSVVSFLKENNFSPAQLEKIVFHNPRVLGFSVECIKLRFSLFQDLGLSSEEFAKIVTGNKGIFNSSVANRIVPSLSLLKGLLPSNEDVAKLLKKSSWFLNADLERNLMPNVEILKSCGISRDRVLLFLYVRPRCFLAKPVVMRKSVEKSIEIGVSQSSGSFIQAVSLFALSEGIWETKLETLRDLGFSDNDIFTMFRKSPSVFFGSSKRMKNAIEVLLANGKYNISNIVNNPNSLGCSIEKRLMPRLQILELLESRNLIKKWPCLSRTASFTDDKFFDMFIRPYMDEIGKEDIIEKYFRDAYELIATASEFFEARCFEEINSRGPRCGGDSKSLMFILAVGVIASRSEQTWETQVSSSPGFGISDRDFTDNRVSASEHHITSMQHHEEA